ncbi:NnrS protein [compost metagenome]
MPTSIAWAFALMQLATLARVILPLFTSLGVSVSALCWSLALLLFLRHYLPILLRPRADGMPG